jgi:hypothetical protein
MGYDMIYFLTGIGLTLGGKSIVKFTNKQYIEQYELQMQYIEKQLTKEYIEQHNRQKEYIAQHNRQKST